MPPPAHAAYAQYAKARKGGPSTLPAAAAAGEINLIRNKSSQKMAKIKISRGDSREGACAGTSYSYRWLPDDYMVTLLTTSSRCTESEQMRWKKPCSVCCCCCWWSCHCGAIAADIFHTSLKVKASKRGKRLCLASAIYCQEKASERVKR